MIAIGFGTCIAPLQADTNNRSTYAIHSPFTSSFPVCDDDITVPVYHDLRETRSSGYLPSSYNAVNAGKVTSVKNQNPWGTCWAFGAINSLESSLISENIRINGVTATNNNTDLSERHLAYFTYHTATDPLGNTAGDSVVITGENYLDKGGNNFKSMLSLADWKEAAAEADAPYSDLYYSTSNMDIYDLSTSIAYQDAAVLKDAQILNFANRDEIKEMIQTYGAGSASLQAGDVFSVVFTLTNLEYQNGSVRIYADQTETMNYTDGSTLATTNAMQPGQSYYNNFYSNGWVDYANETYDWNKATPRIKAGPEVQHGQRLHQAKREVQMDTILLNTPIVTVQQHLEQVIFQVILIRFINCLFCLLLLL